MKKTKANTLRGVKQNNSPATRTRSATSTSASKLEGSGSSSNLSNSSSTSPNTPRKLVSASLLELQKLDRPTRSPPAPPVPKEGETEAQLAILKAKVQVAEKEYTTRLQENQTKLTELEKKLTEAFDQIGEGSNHSNPAHPLQRRMESFRGISGRWKNVLNSSNDSNSELAMRVSNISPRGSLNSNSSEDSDLSSRSNSVSSDFVAAEPADTVRVFNPLYQVAVAKKEKKMKEQQENQEKERFYEFGDKETEDNIIYDDDIVEIKQSPAVIKAVDNLQKSAQHNRRASLSPAGEELSGNLEVKVIEGRNLVTSKDSSTLKSDPYVVIRIKRPGKEGESASQKTKTIKRTPNPHWNETFSFSVNDPKKESLVISVWSHNMLSAPDHMGDATIDLSELSPEISKDLWVPLQGGLGSVHLAITYLKTSTAATENQIRLKGATLRKLIEKLTPPSKTSRDADFMTDFLLGYRPFCTPQQLLDLLIERYNGPAPDNYPDAAKFERTIKGIQQSVASVIYAWLDDAFEFQDDLQLSTSLKQFLNSIQKRTLPIERCEKKLSNLLAAASALNAPPSSSHRMTSLERFLTCSIQDENCNVNNSANPGTLDSSMNSEMIRQRLGGKGGKIQFSDVDAGLIADQLTLIEYAIVKRIRTTEFHKQAWSKSEKITKAPHILQYIQWFNRVSMVVSTDIVKRPTPAERSVVIGKWIQTGVRLMENHNYNAVMEVISALHSAAISRLHQSWALLPTDLMESFSVLTQLLSPNENFKQYREACKKARPTCVPYLGLQLQDLTFIDDANPDTLESPVLINFEKVKMVSRRIKEFRDGLRTPYSSTCVEPVQDLWFSAESWSENDIFRMSKLKEQRSDDDEAKPPSRFDSKSFEKVTKSILSGKTLVSSSNKLTKRDWNLLIACSHIETHNKNSVIVEEGSLNGRFYRIKTGNTRVEKLLKNEESGLIENKVVAALKPNQTFGEMSCLDTYGVASASVIADEDRVQLYAIEMEFMVKLFDSEPGLAMRFYSRMAQQLAEKLVSLSSSGPKELQKLTKLTKKEKSSEDPKNSDDESGSYEQLPGLSNNNNSADNILARKFKLDNEVIIKTYRASLKKRIVFNGHIFVSQRYLCFYSKSFGYTAKEKIMFSEIVALSVKNDKELLVEKRNEKIKFSLHEKKEANDAYELTKQIWNRKSISEKSLNEYKTVNRRTSETVVPGLPVKNDMSKVFKVLSAKDWDMILKGGAKSVTVPKDGPIISQGEQYQRIYQISRGVCRTEIEKDGKKIVLGRMAQGETFGEISFLLQGKGASASVIADSEEGVDLTIIEGYFINALFNIHADFAGRFFKYLATLLAYRIRDRQSS